MTHISPVKQRLLITFGKYDALKFTGNLDVAKIWERVLRRADLPIMYTQGFNTRARIALVSPLPLGITSECEILDVAMREAIPLDDVLNRLQMVSPAGLRIISIEEIDIKASSLPMLVRSAEYRLHPDDPIERLELKEKVDAIIASPQIIKTYERKNRRNVVDLRPMIFDLFVDENGDLLAHLANGDRGNLRPEELIEQMGLNHIFFNIHRLKLHFDEYYHRIFLSK